MRHNYHLHRIANSLVRNREQHIDKISSPPLIVVITHNNHYVIDLSEAGQGASIKRQRNMLTTFSLQLKIKPGLVRDLLEQSQDVTPEIAKQFAVTEVRAPEHLNVNSVVE
jgi:hypothetical protein